MNLFWTHSLWLTLSNLLIAVLAVSHVAAGGWKGAPAHYFWRSPLSLWIVKLWFPRAAKEKKKKHIFVCLKRITEITVFFLKCLYFQWIAQGTHPNTAEGRSVTSQAAERKWDCPWAQTFFRSFNTCSSMPSSAKRSRTPSITSSITDR